MLVNKDSSSHQGIGGKATNLVRLESMGINVPKWAVVPADILLKQISDQTDKESLKKQFENLVLPSEIMDELVSYFGSDAQEKSYAVRSSATDEDGAQFSFAGQFETFLHVPFNEIEEKILNIWQSVISDRVIKYREENGLGLELGIGVIIQEMVPSEVAGVAFGIDPVSGDKTKKIVSAVYGLGEGLVSGELDADTFTVSSDNIDERLAIKTHAFSKSKLGTGIEKIKVAEEKQNVATLNKEQLLEIAGMLDQLNDRLAGPQDIEFAFHQNKLFLFQTRPITTNGNTEQGEYILWDNSNIVESYPGVTTPLTFSFIEKMYEKVYRQFMGLLGVTDIEVDRNSVVFKNTLGLVRGRVYYNLLTWYKMLAMVPGYSLNAEYMEIMMGVKERFELKEDYKMTKKLAWFRIAGMLFNMIRLQRNLSKERDQFLKHLDGVMTKYKSIAFNALSPSEIVKYYKTFETTLLLEWKAPLINDFFAMIWFGMLQKQTAKYCPDEPNIHNDLLCGSQDIISVEPIHRSLEITKLVKNDATATQLFKSESPQDIWTALCNGVHPAIKKSIENYIDKFGDRCVGELKLETISHTQNPTLFVKVIKSYVTQGITQKRKDNNIENDLRGAAQKGIASCLKGSPIKQWWFNYVLNKARDLVSNRENLRFERTRGFGMVRTMFSALGEKLYEQGILKDARDVFYLELAEIKQLDTNSFSEELKQHIDKRKLEFSKYKEQEPPQERFFSYGNNFSDEFIYSKEKLAPIEGDLKGIGCCPGIVQAKVRVVNDPDELDSLNGDILVTSSTDPGWVTLFPTASAIIVERGSLLSHSAIVSREMGIPCIVSITGLLRTLKTGDEVLMDGSTGEIKIITE